MTGGTSFLLLVLLACGLVAAAAMDWRSRIIPNWLNAAIACGAIPFWLATRTPLWPDAAIHVGVAAILFAVFAIAFRFGMMGGGDVKMRADAGDGRAPPPLEGGGRARDSLRNCNRFRRPVAAWRTVS